MPNPQGEETDGGTRHDFCSRRKEKSMSELNTVAKQIIQILSSHKGPEARILRRDLLAELQEEIGDVADREMRAAIEELRRMDRMGAWICADIRGGYFMARDEEELNRYLQSDERRAANLLVRVRNQRETAGLEDSKQMELL